MITITVLRPQNRSALLDLKSYTGDVHKSSPIFHFHSQKTKTQLKTNAHTPRGSLKIKIKSAVLFCGRNTSLKSVKPHWKYGFLTRVSWQVHHRAIEDLKQQSSCVFNTVVQSFYFIGICSFLQADISHVRNRPPINIQLNKYLQRMKWCSCFDDLINTKVCSVAITTADRIDMLS